MKRYVNPLDMCIDQERLSPYLNDSHFSVLGAYQQAIQALAFVVDNLSAPHSPTTYLQRIDQLILLSPILSEQSGGYTRRQEDLQLLMDHHVLIKVIIDRAYPGIDIEAIKALFFHYADIYEIK